MCKRCQFSKHKSHQADLQNVKGLSPFLSAVMMLPLVLTQSVTSTLAGLFISLRNKYGIVIWLGFFTWTLGSGLLIMSNADTNLGLFAFYLIIIGAGTGCTFQPTLVTLQAQTPAIQRAVVTSKGNFLRSSGGAIGLAVSSAVLANTLRAALPADLAEVANNSFATPNLSSFTSEQRQLIAQGYALASRNVFIWCTPLTGVCLILCLFIKDRGLQRKEEVEKMQADSQADPASVEKEGIEPRVDDVGSPVSPSEASKDDPLNDERHSLHSKGHSIDSKA